MGAVERIRLFIDRLPGVCESRASDLKNMIEEVFKETGVLLERIYLGKACLWIYDIIKTQSVTGNVLSGHTGRILNVIV